MANGGPSALRGALCAIALLLATALALVGSAAHTADAEKAAAGSQRALVEVARAATPSVARRVERIRDLRFESIPEPRVVTADFLTALAKRQARKQFASAKRGLAADEAAARLLGLLAPDEDLDGALTAPTQLAAAAYDTEGERLFVIRDAVQDDRALIEFVLAHELDHALEDQRFGLAEGAGESDDAALAELSLTEGTATALMIEYGRLHLDPGELLAATVGLDAGTGGVPDVLVEQLEFAYLEGAAFVDALYRRSGGWELVDRALAERPPASTEQVIHPGAYLRAEEPLPVPIGRGAPAGWRRVDASVLGEYPTVQLLELGAPPAVARSAAAGWGGDRYALYAPRGAEIECSSDCREQLALVVRWRWDSVAEAREFARTVPVLAVAGLGGQQVGRDAWSLEGGRMTLSERPSETVIVFAPSESLARELLLSAG